MPMSTIFGDVFIVAHPVDKNYPSSLAAAMNKAFNNATIAGSVCNCLSIEPSTVNIQMIEYHVSCYLRLPLSVDVRSFSSFFDGYI